ncbi:MAG: hypothetical protein DIU55_004730 [Bacillota bacterium]|nr:MAG: hypothetical protein DIU55_04690 [Bacillota bacterium]
MPQNMTIRQLLQDLRGSGFNTSLVLDGVVIRRQKVVAFENDVVFTVDRKGLARATRIDRIDSVDF